MEINGVKHNNWNKNTLERNISRITEAEVKISELENGMIEIIATEKTKVKRMKINENRLRDFWAKIKSTNIWIIGVPEEEEKEKGAEEIFHEFIIKLTQHEIRNSYSNPGSRKSHTG